jgi:hypothetical protein
MKSAWRTSHKQIGEQENSEDWICFSVTMKCPQMRRPLSAGILNADNPRRRHTIVCQTVPFDVPSWFWRGHLRCNRRSDYVMSSPPTLISPLKLTRTTCRELDSSLSTANWLPARSAIVLKPAARWRKTPTTAPGTGTPRTEFSWMRRSFRRVSARTAPSSARRRPRDRSIMGSP